MKTEKKLLVRWSAPYRVESRIRNSYYLVNLDGSPIRYKDGREAEGTFSSRRLRRFIPRPGTKLAEHEEGVAETEDLGDVIGDVEEDDDTSEEEEDELGDEEEVSMVDIAWMSTRASPCFGGAHGLGSPGGESPKGEEDQGKEAGRESRSSRVQNGAPIRK
ncbi:hypothetical protein BDZ89DRAFT_1034223 [Hymenopellis radicata]|nr:hypothetical protein BDZ89DRAFT_1034223 [Hymenopellis radicata]